MMIRVMTVLCDQSKFLHVVLSLADGKVIDCFSVVHETVRFDVVNV